MSVPPLYAHRSVFNSYRYAQLYAFDIPTDYVFSLIRIITGHGPKLVMTLAHRMMGMLHLDAGVDGDEEDGMEDDMADGDDDDEEASDGDGEEPAEAQAVAGGLDPLEDAASLPWEVMAELARGANMKIKKTLGGFVGRSARGHHIVCRKCLKGESTVRALHKCQACYFVYHTSCCTPAREKMPLPGAEWCCPACCLILERAFIALPLGEDDDEEVSRVEMVFTLIPVDSRTPLGPFDCIQSKKSMRRVWLLFTAWALRFERSEKRWSSKKVRTAFYKCLKELPARALFAIDQALDGRRSAHPYISISVENNSTMGKRTVPVVAREDDEEDSDHEC